MREKRRGLGEATEEREKRREIILQ